MCVCAARTPARYKHGELLFPSQILALRMVVINVPQEWLVAIYWVTRGGCDSQNYHFVNLSL